LYSYPVTSLTIACLDELAKIAARVPVQHASAWKQKVLRPRIGKATFAGDPNDGRVYTAILTKRTRGAVVGFGRQQRDRLAKRDGPVFLHKAKVDTKKGWRPRLTPEAQKAGYSVEDMHDLATSLDDPKLTRKTRGPIWKKLHKLTGTWINTENPGAAVKVRKVRTVDPDKWRSAPARRAS
jgi:hypothetical protein